MARKSYDVILRRSRCGFCFVRGQYVWRGGRWRRDRFYYARPLRTTRSKPDGQPCESSHHCEHQNKRSLHSPPCTHLYYGPHRFTGQGGKRPPLHKKTTGDEKENGFKPGRIFPNRRSSTILISHAPHFWKLSAWKYVPSESPGAPALGHSTCITFAVCRVPTRSASSSKWGRRGPLAGWYGSFPPAS